MGQTLQSLSWTRPEEDEMEEEEKAPVLQLTHEPSSSFSSLGAQYRPPTVGRVYGLNEVRTFLDRKLLAPLRYNRRMMSNPQKIPLELLQQNIISVDKLMIVMGRASGGKRSLLQEICQENHLTMKLLSTREEMAAFDMSTFLTSLTSETVLVVESTIMATDTRVIDHLHYIIRTALSLPINSYLQSVVVLVHSAYDFDTLKLNQFMLARFNSIYARVPPADARKEFIRKHIAHFMEHKLVVQMENLVNFTYEFDNYLEKLSKASAWYTMGEIEIFLERCYNAVLVNLIAYSEQTQIPHDSPMIRFNDIVESYLLLSKDANPVLTLTTDKKEQLSQPFEMFFGLKLVDIESTNWLIIIDPQLAASSSSFSSKRTIAEATSTTPPSTTAADPLDSFIAPEAKKPRMTEETATTTPSAPIPQLSAFSLNTAKI